MVCQRGDGHGRRWSDKVLERQSRSENQSTWDCSVGEPGIPDSPASGPSISATGPVEQSQSPRCRPCNGLAGLPAMPAPRQGPGRQADAGDGRPTPRLRPDRFSPLSPSGPARPSRRTDPRSRFPRSKRQPPGSRRRADLAEVLPEHHDVKTALKTRAPARTAGRSPIAGAAAGLSRRRAVSEDRSSRPTHGIDHSHGNHTVTQPRPVKPTHRPAAIWPQVITNRATSPPNQDQHRCPSPTHPGRRIGRSNRPGSCPSCSVQNTRGRPDQGPAQ